MNVIIGVCRCGKSKLMEQFIDYIRETCEDYLLYFESGEVISDFDKYYFDGGMSGSYLSYHEEYTYEGIKVVDIAEWLKNN